MENSKLDPGSVGHHIIANLHGIKNSADWDSVEAMKELMYSAAKKANMNIVGETWKKFKPMGLTGVLLLSESHMSIHFWPEKNFLSFDVYTCGDEGDPEVAFEYVKEKLDPNMGKSSVIRLDRSIYQG